MRIRMGKGQVLVFDAFIENKVNEMKSEKGFYPPLREIGECCTPTQSPAHIHRALRRLAAAGRLSNEALQVYNAKNNEKYIKGNSHENVNNDQKTKGSKSSKSKR